MNSKGYVIWHRGPVKLKNKFWTHDDPLSVFPNWVYPSIGIPSQPSQQLFFIFGFCKCCITVIIIVGWVD
jgi:hypothetical protein